MAGTCFAWLHGWAEFRVKHRQTLSWRPVAETATSLEVAGWKAPSSCQPRSLQQHPSPLLPWAGHGKPSTQQSTRCSSYWKRSPTVAWNLSFLCRTVFSPHFCYLWLLTNYAVQTLQPWEEGQVSMAFCFWSSSLAYKRSYAWFCFCWTLPLTPVMAVRGSVC